jgi:Peroxidase
MLTSLILFQGECNGPHIQMQYGRKDTTLSFNTNALPASGERFGSIIAKFSEMGFTVREMTILSVGGHSIGAARRTADMSANVVNRQAYYQQDTDL